MFLARVFIFLMLLVTAASAQSNPGFTQGQILGATQLNNAFTSKQDFPIPPGAITGIGGVTFSGTPSPGWVPIASSPTAAAWGPISGSGVVSFTVLANPAALGSSPLATTITNVTVTAMAAGTSTCGLNFIKGTSTPTGIYGEVLNVPSGVYWEPQYVSSPVLACQFGTVADGSINQSTNAVSGTDNTAIIQAALNYAMQNGYNAVCLNDGNYRTTDTLHLGWGQTFTNIGLVSCSGGRATFAVGGPQIYTTVIDRCAINIQGSRTSIVKGIAVIGQNATWAFSGGFPAVFPTAPSGWLNPAITPTGTNPGGIQRYSPYGGICTDSYAGQPPSTLGAFGNYPFVTNYPAFTQLGSTTVSISNASPAVVTWPGSPGWLTANCQSGTLQFYGRCPIIFTSGALPAALSLNTLYYVVSFLSPTTFTISATPGGAAINTASAASGVTAARQYGMTLSTNVLIEDSDIQGFAVNINSNSSTNQGQNDFLKVNRTNVGFCVYCVSIGNDQSRNVDLNDLTFEQTHTFLTNNKFGEQVGELGGPINNISGGQSYQIFDISGTTFGFPITINNLYTEATVRIGVINASGGNSVFINGCNLAFGNSILPAAYLDSTSGGTLFLKDCAFSGGYNRIDVFTGSSDMSVTIDGGSFVLGVGSLPFLNLPGIPVAANYTGSVLISGYSSIYPNANRQKIRWIGNTVGLAMTSQVLTNKSHLQDNVDFNLFPSRAPLTQASRGFFDGNTNQWHEFLVVPPPGEVNLSSGTYVTVPAAISSCDVLTFSYRSAMQATNAGSTNINPGDMLYWEGDGTLFVVTQVAALSGGAYPITARQMNNMVIDFPGAYTCNTNRINDPTLTGNTLIIHSAGVNFNSVAPIGAGAPGGVMIPQTLSYGDFANGSTAVKNVSPSGPTGAATTLTTFMKAGDIMWGMQATSDPAQNWPYPAQSTGPLTSTTNGTPGSAVLGVAANSTGRFPFSPLPLKGMGNYLTSLPAQAFAALPTCAVGILGLVSTVTDSTTTTPGATITGGSTGKVQAVCNSANNWVVQFAL